MPKRGKITIRTLKKELKDVPITSLVPSEENPRVTDDGVPHVRDSLVEFGYIKTSIGVDEDMILLYGHTTLRAFNLIAEKPHFSEEDDVKTDNWGRIANPFVVPEVTQIFGLTEDQKRAYRIVDNRAGEFTMWDSRKLVEQLQKLEESEFDLSKIGFSDFDIQDMLASIVKVDDKPALSTETGEDESGGEEFPEYDGTTTTQYHCPKCGFEWNGKSGQKKVEIKSLAEQMKDDNDPE